MRRDPRAYLWDARESADAISQFITAKQLHDYLADALLRAAVERKLEIIGEALNQLTKVSPELAVQIPELSQAIGLRNILIHGYTVTDDEIVWRTAQTSVPALRNKIDELLKQLGEL